MSDWDQFKPVETPAATTAKPASWDDFAPVAEPSPQTKAAVAATDNPEEAGKALGIAKQTGIPASIVQTDLPGYEAHARTQSAIQAVQNPAIAQYIDSHPMAAQVSNGDYDNLQEASETLRVLQADAHQKKVSGGIFGALMAVPEMGSMLASPAGRNKLFDALKQLPSALAQGVGEFFETAGKFKAGELNINSPEGLDAAISMGIGLALGGRDIKLGRPKGLEGIPGDAANNRLAGNEAAIRRTSPVMTVDEFVAQVRGMNTRDEMDAFIRAKAEAAQPGILQLTQSKMAAEDIQAAAEAAQNTNTLKQSPDFYEKFAGNEHNAGDATVHVPASKIMELYEKAGKTPAEGDGLFGNVPDIVQQLQSGVETGAEVAIPVSQYITHTAPEVIKQLSDVTRLHPNGTTPEEAKAAIEAYHGTPHDFESFDLSKIGTGEGVQVYGHGLYFAENRKVGDDYRKNLSTNSENARIDGKPYDSANIEHRAALAVAERGHAYALDDAEVYLMNMKNEAVKYPEYKDAVGQAQQVYDLLKSNKPLPKVDQGVLYKVHINADPTHFLDWDKPLAEQSQHVQDVILKLANPTQIDLIKSGLNVGEQLKLGHLPGSFDINSPEFAKQYAEAGIPGIKYLDQGSRAGGTKNIANVERAYESAKKNFEQAKEAGIPADELAPLKETLDIRKTEFDNLTNPTRNFVVFDDKLVKIIEKNDNPIVQAVEAATAAAKASLGLSKSNFLTPYIQDASVVGRTKPEFDRIAKLIDNEQEEILTRAVEVAKREVAKRQTPVWKQAEAETKAAVAEELARAPAILADRYFNGPTKGTLPNGKKILSSHFVPMGEAKADEWAPIFGFETGSEMTAAVLKLEGERADAGKGPKWQFDKMVKEETARRMEASHGNLADNIMIEASEMALSEYQVDVMNAKLAWMAKAGEFEPPHTKEWLTASVKDGFEGGTVARARDYETFRRSAEKAGREVEKQLLKGDYVEAFKAQQSQMLSVILAREAKSFQKLADRTDAIIDRVSKEESIGGLDQVYLDQLRQMLAGVGYENKFVRPSGQLDTPAQFVADSQGQIAVAPWMVDPAAAQFNGPYDMSVRDYRALRKSIDSMMHVGREVKKLITAQGKADLENAIFDINQQQDRFNLIDQPINPSYKQRINSLGRWLTAVHILPERVFDYIDQFDPNGPLTRYLDRPLRDSNVKEIQLNEMASAQIKALKEHVDDSINDRIENKVIPNKFSPTGFLDLTRQNLRHLMLHMGNESNLNKAADGFGVTPGDLWQLVRANASAKDIAWVNGMHKLFADLKIEADVMELRDTGVPADTLEAVSQHLPNGKMTGGYAPLVYDRIRSDQQQVLAAKNPLFDQHYIPATTPKGYTQERTAYKGQLDLSGALLTSKIRGMIHDIAFREAIRSASKLINHPDFIDTMTAKWGAEISGLLPGWLKDIANVHAVDDSYAQGAARVASIIRQNTTSALIFANPGTVLKHGITAAAMSANQVGIGRLLSSTADIGAKGMYEAARDLWTGKTNPPPPEWWQALKDITDPGERGESQRKFILDSSAVMRNRQRASVDNVRSRMDQASNVGLTQTFADMRHTMMDIGRYPVALSDAFSAFPTWLAAYNKAATGGAEHPDAVFIADKEVSRAHGSSFIGDKPLVTRQTNEIMRWATPLYNFWNHMFNNYAQFAWDVAAGARGAKELPGGPPVVKGNNSIDFVQDESGTWRYAQEPGANAKSYAKRVFLLMMIPILAEEFAGPPGDEHKDGMGMHVVKTLARHFGGSFVGLRELTNGFAGGYEPSVGLIGTVGKALHAFGKDIGNSVSSGTHASKDWMVHTATALGIATGMIGPAPMKSLSFGIDVLTGKDRPQGFNQYRQGLRTGHSKGRRF